ncbi:TRAP transporter large permease [Amphritea balenae]|uniref:TRAP transporter large permease protein n=1 Tax=Amphritea balenae TaxID=452629 RepID=A0A3P1SWS4_9GAMM|nr:TRAP transporter large permease subunit [Amphritea balenae]RRD01435.1 TRAP transporter large permease subunit [Amphritea balenae]GGK57142.1 C4-dicarboxylate ABC transporter permease [Amphritea balenae]
MDVLMTMGIMLALIILFLGLGVWVFVGLFLVAITSLTLIADFPLDRVGYIARSVIWRSSSAWELSAIPLFIWMGEIIFRTDISDRLFRGLSPFVQWMPGRLLHTNVLGCTLFAAVSGSTSATTATVGKITTTALAERSYNNSLSVGSLAGAGSLGLLIPPSIVMIIYGVLAEVSIAKLFAAGIMPGLLVAFLYSSYIIVRCIVNPELAPRSEEKLTFTRLLSGLKDLTPIVTLIVLVLGGIYSGIATPSEAAAVGVAATFMLVIFMGSFSWDIVIEAAMGAVKTSCMVCSILISAAFLSTAIGYLHIPVELVKMIESLALSPYALLGILALFYILLGFFLDGISIIVMSLPITLPLILQAGFDPIWYGVFLVLMVELAQMTPPVGFNLFILQGLTGQSIGRVVQAAFPFFVLMCVAVVIVSFFPQVVLLLPNLM